MRRFIVHTLHARYLNELTAAYRLCTAKLVNLWVIALWLNARAPRHPNGGHA